MDAVLRGHKKGDRWMGGWGSENLFEVQMTRRNEHSCEFRLNPKGSMRVVKGHGIERSGMAGRSLRVASVASFLVFVDVLLLRSKQVEGPAETRNSEKRSERSGMTGRVLREWGRGESVKKGVSASLINECFWISGHLIGRLIIKSIVNPM